MATTINGAFDEFMFYNVNLDKDEVPKARSSRDWLLDKIASFDDDTNFPKLASVYNLHYGSFSRRTKIRPLDDIDIMLGLHGQGGTWLEFPDKCQITISTTSNLSKFCHEGSYHLNSRKIIESFKSKLVAIDQYKEAEIKRNLEAVTLSLSSYDWVFDLVPTFHTNMDFNGKDYYLIPDGNGHWKKTNPQIDQENVTSVNRKHNGYILNLIRVLKYWNSRPTAPRISSYLLENIAIDYFNTQNTVSQFLSRELEGAFRYISTAINYDYPDPKGIQGNINDNSIENRQKVSARASADADASNAALYYEDNLEISKAIQLWGAIFGDKFPTYG